MVERPGTEVLLGARDAILPLPAAVVVDRAGTVRFVDVPADPPGGHRRPRSWTRSAGSDLISGARLSACGAG
jgi:hypothetical protein